MVAYRLDYDNGSLIDGKYRVVGRIGKGSYGDVFRVHDAEGHSFALKLLRLWEVSTDLHEQLNRRFEQEYNTARIASEYLVHSLDFGIIEGNPYLLMEYCPDGDLSKLIGKDVPQPANCAHDILEGLYALHSSGKLHRDLKPENVLIRKDGRFALTDFGVVGEMDRRNRLSESGWIRKRPKQVQGTPLYMAPEMAARVGGGVTYLPTVDLWSFGVMMYELLTKGSFPFGNIETIEELASYQERAKKGDWDEEKLRSVPHSREWTRIVRGCLEPDYRNRYQSALDVMLDLRPVLGESAAMMKVSDRKSRSSHITRLEITQGDNVGSSYMLSACQKGGRRMIRVGRETGNDIVLPDNRNTYVSRYHFTLERSADGTYWTIKDGQWRAEARQWCASTNGTYLNSTPVSTGGLRVFTGDIITVGEYKIKVE